MVFHRLFTLGLLSLAALGVNRPRVAADETIRVDVGAADGRRDTGTPHWHTWNVEDGGEAVAKHRARVIAELGPNDQHHEHHVLRQAVRRALLELGLLTITRRSIPLPLNAKKRDRIT